MIRGGCRVAVAHGRNAEAKSLNEKVEELRTAPIAFLDARWARKVENVLVAYGIGPDGRRQLLAATIGTEESEDSWSELLAQLVEPGAVPRDRPELLQALLYMPRLMSERSSSI